VADDTCEHFTAEEIHDLRKLLEQIHDVATDDDVIASKIHYKGNEVVLTAPENVKNVISEALKEVTVEVDN